MFHSPQRKSVVLIIAKPNALIIIFGAKYEFFFPPYQLTFFSPFYQTKRFFSYQILTNTLNLNY